MSQDLKSFFHEWCSRNKVEPSFETRPTGELQNYDVGNPESINQYTDMELESSLSQ